ncbi:hypothetical protein [Leeuwenhoekiella sp. NPDC079379]|uniref:hypothetical protein n=1 Tax=Leeuwenhoekiella sp. NPDC079379 TaxID=3364122 RepID=UPI0037C5AB1D
MRRILFLFFIGTYFLNAQVGIGTTEPSTAAMLEVSSLSSDGSYKGFMPPRVTSESELNSIANQANASDIGLLVFYNNDALENCLKIWDGTQFKNVYCINTTSEITVASFTTSKQTITENSGGIPLDFTIENPSPFNSLILTISASDYSNLVEDAPVKITISRGYNTFTIASAFNYLDNSLIQGNSNITFTITEISGGDGTPQIGSENTHSLGIIDDDIKLWINEFRYENTGSDIAAAEFVELAGNALDISGYQIVHYNGADGEIIRTVVFSGAIPDQQAGYGTIRTTITLQNGPDGIALVDPLGNVLQFISYEGSFIASEGPAAGMTAFDVGIIMPTTVPEGYSLKLTGIGNSYSDFDWDGPDVESPGAINLGQTFN